MKVTETQVAAACRILQAYVVAYGAGGVDSRQRAACFSILAVMTAQPDRVDAEFRAALAGIDYTDLPKIDPDMVLENPDAALAAANAKIAELNAAIAELTGPDADGNEAEPVDKALEARTVTQLQSIAADVGVEIPSGSKKSEIINLIMGTEIDPADLDASLANHPPK